jgi:transposase InsO family protein
LIFGAVSRYRRGPADITSIETNQGWLGRAAGMHLYSSQDRRLGMDDHLHTELPLAALRIAISAQRPSANLTHHSDRGVQFASADYRKTLQSADIQASMSRKADCYDNAPTESFFHTLKAILVHRRQYATRDEAKRDIFAYIEVGRRRARPRGGGGVDRARTCARVAACESCSIAVHRSLFMVSGQPATYGHELIGRPWTPDMRIGTPVRLTCA